MKGQGFMDKGFLDNLYERRGTAIHEIAMDRQQVEHALEASIACGECGKADNDQELKAYEKQRDAAKARLVLIDSIIVSYMETHTVLPF